MQQTDAVAAFRALHAARTVLLLPNVWDAGSAAVVRSAGAKAIATTSAGVAWTCGYPDGDAIPRNDLFFMLRAIRHAAGETPVSADIEGGYSNDPAEVAQLVRLLRETGIAGINLEDGMGTPELLAEKIKAVKDDGEIFVNARVDVYLNELATGEAALRETIARVKRYEAAGADGIFVPMLADRDIIRAVAAETKLPLGIFAIPGLPAVSELYELGVRRLSAGPAITKLALGATRRAAVAFVEAEDLEALFSGPTVGFDEMNAFFTA